MNCWNLPPWQGWYTTKGQRPNPLTHRRSGRPTSLQKSKLTRALSIAEDECYLKIYQHKPPPNTNNSGHQTQIPTTPLPKTIQTVTLVCNAKGIPNAIARKNSKTKTVKTIGLEVYAWWWLIRAETCSELIVFVILILLLCRRKIYCDLQ